MIFIKKKGNRYYKESRRDFRSFPIKKVEAEKLITEGKAELVERFIWDIEDLINVPEQQEQPIKVITEQPKNIISLQAKREQKQEAKLYQEELAKAKDHFLNHIIPNVSRENLLRLTECSKEDFKAEFTRIILEASINQTLGSL